MWETFVNTVLNNRDPRRSKPLVDLILSLGVDFAAESAFAVTKRLTLLGGLLDSLGSRIGDVRADELSMLLFKNIQTPYAEVRSQISVNLAILISIQWHPRYPSAAALLEASMNENDPLFIRGPKYLPQVLAYVEQLPKWREERLPPPRVSHSTYDRVGLALLQWIWSTAYSMRASSMFPYVMPLLPEIFKMAELNDSSDIQLYSGAVLYILSAVTPPQEFVEPVMDQFIDAVKSSPSWRIRLSVLPVLQVFYFRNLLNLPDSCAKRIMDVLLKCLRDENVEVRDTASKTLSGVIRCSQQHSILPLRDRFARLARRTKLPKRQDKELFSEALRTLHSAILGLVALVDAYPYSVEPWVPETFEILARYSSDPPPISTSIRKCAASFKQTHQDTWAMDQLLFNEDQMLALSTVVSGTSYYA
ncbi:hypothetical protein FRC02_010498 [Tulasnella sp. 418]|nr:hypothetical protein FRC02_010498 [Tulasnella sp. 418]